MTANIALWIRKKLSSNKLPVIVVCLAVILTLSSVNTGFQFDDFVHWMKMHQFGPFADESPFRDFFVFRDGSPETGQSLVEMGRTPWWTLPELRIAFFRPVSVATHWLDYRLWPRTPALMHLHSLLWLAMMVLAAALVYRRFITPAWAAGLAVLLFAIDDAHGAPAGWIANRNALIAAVFGFICLYMHDRWRRDGWRAGAVLAPICFLSGLLSAEIGMGIAAYLFSYELFLGPGRWQDKLRAIAPYAIIGALWLVSYRVMGYGTYGSGAYVDPGRAPLAFLLKTLERLPVLLYGQWLVPEVGIYGFLPKPWTYAVLGVVYVILAIVFVVMFPLLKRNATARFFALGLLLALLPVSATQPHGRLLIFAGLGGMGLLAQLLAAWFEKESWLPTRRAWRWTARPLVIILIVANLVYAPLALPMMSRDMYNMNRMTLKEPLRQLSDATAISGKQLVFINPPVPFTISFIPFVCWKMDIVPPASTYALGSGLLTPFTLARVDDYTLDIEPANGFINQDLERLYRGANHPMQVGQEVETNLFRAKILTMTPDQRPLQVRFTFSVPLEDESLVFCKWQDYGFAPMQPPPVGQQVTLELAMVPL